MNIKEVVADISAKLDKFEWYYDVEHDANNITVYVNWMNADVFNTVPAKLHDFNVKLAYASFFTCEDKYAKVPRNTPSLLEEVLERSELKK